MSAPTFILVEPQMGENIGAAARAMWNFGLDRMRIVNPRDGWPNERAEAMATGATHVLSDASLHETTREATADLSWVYATTARPRDLTKRVLTPEAAAHEMRERIAAGDKVGVLFGRERSGLENEDIERSSAVITVPVNPAFGSLNLAQCSLLIGYEWLKVADKTPPEDLDPGRDGFAVKADVDCLIDFMETELSESGFFFPEDKKASMLATLRNLYHRMPLTAADLRMLWGTTRSLAAKRRSTRR